MHTLWAFFEIKEKMICVCVMQPNVKIDNNLKNPVVWAQHNQYFGGFSLFSVVLHMDVHKSGSWTVSQIYGFIFFKYVLKYKLYNWETEILRNLFKVLRFYVWTVVIKQ